MDGRVLGNAYKSKADPTACENDKLPVLGTHLFKFLCLLGFETQLGSLGSPSFVTLSNLPFRQVLMPPRPAALAEAGWPQSRLGALCSPAASWSSAAGEAGVTGVFWVRGLFSCIFITPTLPVPCTMTTGQPGFSSGPSPFFGLSQQLWPGLPKGI